MMDQRPKVNYNVPEAYVQVFSEFKDQLISLHFTGARLNGLLERASKILNTIELEYDRCDSLRLKYFGSKEVCDDYIHQNNLVNLTLEDQREDQDVVCVIAQVLNPKHTIFDDISLLSSSLNVEGVVSITREQALDVFKLNIEEFNREQSADNKLVLGDNYTSQDIKIIHQKLVDWCNSSMQKYLSSPYYFPLQNSCANKIENLDIALRSLLE